ncbi:hypothetical protein KUV80_11140 [Fictibacillus nanhaiensis]|uniref:hypothetical protein n=1 Tax=Fictibacillus nanhaiensis TaxID=742169 RepID=UPI001C97ADC8|nr:hypothetical protein [Fictibacillus nanhaiensis]MBY6037214.1 hypothetical protein [Fictibacillus nanhaiensis]
MEEKLKKLNYTLNKEISKTKVFTEKDEHHILSEINRLSKPKVRQKKPLSLLPRLLTAALFLGILFSSYVFFDQELASDQNVQTKKETPVYSLKVSGQGSVLYTDVDQKQLVVKFLITNKTTSTIKKPLTYRITFMNDKLVNAVGTKSVMIQPENFSPLGPEKSEGISKQFVLNAEVTKEDLYHAVYVETINDDKTLHSFVINQVDYAVAEMKDELAENKKEPSQEKPKEISEGEAKQIFNKNLADIKRTLIESGKKNNWNYENPATYEVAGPDFEPYVTQNFSETVLTKLLPDYYCDCDNGLLPMINQEVRFKAISMKEDTIQVSGIQPATDMTNIGYKWTFNLVKEDDKWKMDHWQKSSLDGIDLKLSKDEAAKLLTAESQTLTFYKEIELENSTKAYVFGVKAEDFETTLAISSKDTTLVYDYE